MVSRPSPALPPWIFFLAASAARHIGSDAVGGVSGGLVAAGLSIGIPGKPDVLARPVGERSGVVGDQLLDLGCDDPGYTHGERARSCGEGQCDKEGTRAVIESILSMYMQGRTYVCIVEVIPL